MNTWKGLVADAMTKKILNEEQAQRVEALREARDVIFAETSPIDVVSLARYIIDGKDPYEVDHEEDDQDDDDADLTPIESVTRNDRAELR